MKGKICLITGGTSGIGKATAFGLAKKGASVVIVGRDKDKAKQTASYIQNKSNNPIDYLIADFSSQNSIFKLAENFKNKYGRLDVLINNAGILRYKRSVSIDGIEMTFAVNHIAYFLLTHLLLDIIERSAPSRIINVSSGAHYNTKLNFDDLMAKKKYRGRTAYNQSKLANILFTYELARRLKGSKVTANCLHPGIIRTNIGNEDDSFERMSLNFLKLFAKTPAQGAATSIYLASSPNVQNVSGKYFVDNKIKSSSPESYRIDIQEKLWRVSKRLIIEK